MSQVGLQWFHFLGLLPPLTILISWRLSSLTRLYRFSLIFQSHPLVAWIFFILFLFFPSVKICRYPKTPEHQKAFLDDGVYTWTSYVAHVVIISHRQSDSNTSLIRTSICGHKMFIYCTKFKKYFCWVCTTTFSCVWLHSRMWWWLLWVFVFLFCLWGYE